MKLFKNGIDLQNELRAFVKSTTNLFIFVPYIKLEALKALLEDGQSCKAIFVRWETKDLITGASDLEVYNYCKERGVQLFRNKRLHLKAFIDDYKKCFLGSANISSRALNFPPIPDYNYELATTVENLSIEDRLYFSIIEQESLLITDHIYDQIVNQMPVKKAAYPHEPDFEIKIAAPDKDFLISSLPLTYNVDTLFRIYDSRQFINDTELNCAAHDLALYRINFGLTMEQFESQLRREFFSHPFIKAFLEKINDRGEIYFGEAKAWIHANCSNAPLPRRWEITENIQILYKWISKLSEGKYCVDKPNHSERLFVSKN